MTTDTGSRVGAPISLSEESLADLETVERSLVIRCATGHRSLATWRGTPVAAVVEQAGIPAETTHLVVASDEGYRSCVDARTALDSVLAVARDGASLDDADRPRFVSPGTAGVRTVKGVSTIEPVSLPPATDPEELEELKLDE